MYQAYLYPFGKRIVRRLRTNMLLLIAIGFFIFVSSVALLTPPNHYSASALTVLTPVSAHDRISIPSIGLSSRYVPVGVTADNKIDVHPSLVGRYTGTSQPGEAGAVFLDGHTPGVLNALDSIEIGASITLTESQGEVFKYKVVHTETVQLIGIDMKKALRPYNGAIEGLNIMTCAGSYNAQLGTTEQRFIVYAVRV